MDSNPFFSATSKQYHSGGKYFPGTPCHGMTSHAIALVNRFKNFSFLWPRPSQTTMAADGPKNWCPATVGVVLHGEDIIEVRGICWKQGIIASQSLESKSGVTDNSAFCWKEALCKSLLLYFLRYCAHGHLYVMRHRITVYNKP